ncbi:hypothetical protein C2845_PM03G16950 [Panicum miliaceum]|uniref:Probable glutamyl endopeptidase, chloroplastic n=1 Tax=Panicum miliaceum TaxID=4540 RepID=A0A3L6TEV5_PANMI|nr:hypothetical protein C2845_PM03G16950 [Panicum miliaceum]
MLKDLHEEESFDFYATSQLVLVTLDGTVKMIAPPAIYISLDPSPDEKYLMLTSVHRPYSSIVSYKRFPKKVELWTIEGKFVREVCDLPLAEDIPVAANSVRKGKRLIRWRPDMPSTLYWVETQDGGDANVEVPPRDIVYMEPAEPLDGEKPQVLLKLDLRYRNTGEKERIWESDKEKYYESILAVISYHPKCEVQLDQLKLLVSKESRREITQYYVKIWPNEKQIQITNYPHPYPQLALLQKEIIRYQREDGVKLTATLYLPPGYSPSEDGPLPCLIWSYPGEFKSKEAAGQVRRSPNKFARISNNFPLLWLARGFAILVDPTIPIIGEGNQEGNDRYVEQLVASAEEAVNEVVRRGVAHPDKIAVGGHSYGAFMTANLLAHAPHLFCCGIARSGAYNRTLTPFGFQKETRTLWEATDTYIKTSPFMSANKIKKPILLIHGEDDSKVTTAMQSKQLYDALKGHGVPCRLVILPFEQHHYAARESIMHIIWETDRWLQKYCATNPGNIKHYAYNHLLMLYWIMKL